LNWTKAYILFTFKFYQYNIIHIHHASYNNFYLNSFFVFVARLFRKRIFLHNHGADFHLFYVSQPFLGKLFIRTIFEKATGTIVLSKSWYAWHRSISSKSTLYLLHNSVDFPKVVNEKSSITQKPIFLYLARLEKRKGISDTLELLPRLFEAFPKSIIYIAGQGDANVINNFLENSSFKSNVHFLGYVNNKEREALLNKAHILLLPSYEEGLPMSLLEAMSYSVVPITTPVGGIPEVIADGLNGYMVEPGDIESIYNKLSDLIRNPSLYEYLSLHARQYILSNHSLDSYKTRLKEIYKSAIKN
jgi:glycosyltransferase involved in cell wall biosynthesis